MEAHARSQFGMLALQVDRQAAGDHVHHLLVGVLVLYRTLTRLERQATDLDELACDQLTIGRGVLRRDRLLLDLVEDQERHLHQLLPEGIVRGSSSGTSQPSSPVFSYPGATWFLKLRATVSSRALTPCSEFDGLNVASPAPTSYCSPSRVTSSRPLRTYMNCSSACLCSSAP